jgi:hypothetical protein
MENMKNRHHSAARWFLVAGLIFGVAAYLPFREGNFLSGVWAVVLLGFFLMISSWITAWIVGKRAKKMDRLLNGQDLIAQWTFSPEQQQDYANYMKSNALAKNNGLMGIIAILFVVISIPFLFFLEKDEMGGFLGIMGSILLIVFIFSRIMPYYYYSRNIKGDGQVLIGPKYAYVNGYFHNWDFPMSGLKKLKVISKPFEGISLTYYYTDRTWRNEHTLNIPTSPDADIHLLMTRILSLDN